MTLFSGQLLRRQRTNVNFGRFIVRSEATRPLYQHSIVLSELIENLHRRLQGRRCQQVIPVNYDTRSSVFEREPEVCGRGLLMDSFQVEQELESGCV